MSNFPPTVDELVEEFEDLQDWDERYDYIIDLGREVPAFDESLQTEANLVSGCMSLVWLVIHPNDDEDKTVDIQADSDSIIVKGLIAVLMAFYSGMPAGKIVESDAIEFFGKLGLNQHLSPQRKNGLYSMVKRLKVLCSEFLAAPQ